jgi:hypothetical protein
MKCAHYLASCCVAYVHLMLKWTLNIRQNRNCIFKYSILLPLKYLWWYCLKKKKHDITSIISLQHYDLKCGWEGGQFDNEQLRGVSTVISRQALGPSGLFSSRHCRLLSSMMPITYLNLMLRLREGGLHA